MNKQRNPSPTWAGQSTVLLTVFAACTLVAAASDCGGQAVIDDLAVGGAGGTTTSSTSTTTSTTTSITTSTKSTTTTTTSTTTNTGGAPPIPPLVEEDFGSVAMATPVAFELPVGALGLTAVARSQDAFGSIGIEVMRAPDGAALIEDFGIPGTLAYYDFFEVITAAAPQTDHPQAMPLMSGTWQFTLASQELTPSALLSVWYRQTLDGAFHGGVIDVNVFAVPGIASDGYLTQLVHDAFDGFSGLGVGTVSILPLSAQFSVVDMNNYADIFAATAGAPGKPALNVMAVSWIDLESQPLGFSPGAPGLPLEHGTLQSAVVMLISGDPSLDRMVLRHESGHFAGLYHTSEIEPGYTDYLDDTPICADINAQFPNCPDITNLMFPYADPQSLMQLSQKQVRVVQASALYRAAVEEGGGFALPLDELGGDGASGNAASSASAAELAQWVPSDASWRQLHDPQVSDILSRLWCGTTPAAQGGYRLLQQLGVSEAELLSIAVDPQVPAYVRARSLSALAYGAPSPGQLQRLAQLAGDGSTPRLVRLGAIGSLRRLAPARLTSLGLDAHADAAIARLAGAR